MGGYWNHFAFMKTLLCLTLLLAWAIGASTCAPSEGFFERPASMEALAHDIVTDSEFLTDFHQTSSDALKSDDAVLARVSGLLNVGCPPTVAFRVSEVVVPTFYGMAFWRISHILKEVYEVSPSLADSDSSTSIMLPVSAVWIRASLNHAAPYLIYSGCLSTDAMSVFEACGSGCFGRGNQILLSLHSLSLICDCATSPARQGAGALQFSTPC
jgi:hypothetical protein